MPDLLDMLARGPVVCAEGYLFECERRGYLQAGAFVPEVVLDHPEVVEELHREFVHAGSDVVEAFTYYGHREKLRVIGKEDILEPLNRQALSIAATVARDTGTLLAGNLCNTNVYEPGSAAERTVRSAFAEQVAWAAEAGVDLIIAETFSWVGEALLALEAIRAAGLPAVVTYAVHRDGTMREGIGPADACRQAEMRHHVLGRGEWRREIVVAVQHQHPQVRILHQRLGEVDAGIHHRLIALRSSMHPFPVLADAVVGGAIGAALPEPELAVVVIEECRGESGADRRRLRVIAGLFVRRAPAESPGRQPSSLLRFAELQDELVGVSANRLVEHFGRAGVRRIGENRTLGVELEPNRFDLSAHRRGLDTMQSLGDIGGSARSGGVIENYVKATGLQRFVYRLVKRGGVNRPHELVMQVVIVSGNPEQIELLGEL